MIENTCAHFNLIAANLTKLSYAISSSDDQLCFICLFDPLLRKLISCPRTFRGFDNIALTVQPMKNGLSVKRKRGFKLFLSCSCQIKSSYTHPYLPLRGVTYALLSFKTVCKMISGNYHDKSGLDDTGLKNHIGNPLKRVSALSFKPLLTPLSDRGHSI